MIDKNKFSNLKQKVGQKTCGPMCLLNIYNFLGIKIELSKILKDLKINNITTTYPGQLAQHLLTFKLKVELLNSNPFVTSPSWKDIKKEVLINKLSSWLKLNKNNRWYNNTKHLFSFIKKGGELKIIDLTTEIIDNYLEQGYILIPCLEESWLWGERKVKDITEFNDIKGSPRGHFVILYGKDRNNYLINDPYPTGIKNREGLYLIDKNKLLVSTLVWSAQIIAVKI